MRYLYLLIISIVLTGAAFGQETSKKTERITNNISEQFNVLNTDGHTREGLYQALYRKKIAIANGAYKNGKRVGLWQFYDPNGKVVQSYNFDKQLLVYEAPEDTTSNLHYFVDRTLDTAKTAMQRVTKPVRIGGRYYGYLPYVSLFKIPKRLSQYNYNDFRAVVELLVSPFGRLAYYKVHLFDRYNGQTIETINMNLKLPNPDDLVFTPATFNGDPISCRVIIECVLNGNGTLDFAY